MTNYIILALCIIILLSYLFDITSRFSKIPSIILLILLGILIRFISESTGLIMPNLEPLLPVFGTLGLIMIVMDASLDITIERGKKRLIIRSVLAAFFLFALFSTILSLFLVQRGLNIRDALLNSIPLSIISSAVAIPSAGNLNNKDKEFIVYESSLSDIIGIIVFDYILIHRGSLGSGLIHFTLNGLLTVIIAIIITLILAALLHKINYHINYVIIMTGVILVFVLAKISNLPALFIVLVFGLTLSNNKLAEHTFIKQFIDFDKFSKDINSFRKILSELTFIVRSFFFILFGYYTSLEGLFSLTTIMVSFFITAGIFLLRWLFFRFVLKIPSGPLIFFAPRGLITILLFLSIPAGSRIPLISEEVITLVIFITIIFLAYGNIMLRKDREQPDTERTKKVNILETNEILNKPAMPDQENG